jgi:1-acyl-sn-glycerol-3-phosphate acyltransferase
MFRFLYLNAFIGLNTIVFCLWAIFLAVFDNTGRLIHRYSAVPWAKTILWACGVKLEVSGIENLDPNSPAIYVSNHQSAFDIYTLLAGLPVTFKFLLKKELMRLPFLGWAMKRARYISIDRGNRRKALESMQEAADRVRKGASILIFPEGTRSDDGHIKPFKKGGFHLALQAESNIVPVSISGSRDILLKGSFKIRKGVIRMKIGRPISTGGYSRKNIDDLIKTVRDTVIDMTNGCNG